jgi:serine/threonine protein kinase
MSSPDHVIVSVPAVFKQVCTDLFAKKYVKIGDVILQMRAKVGDGNYADVYKMCTASDSCNYVAKVVDLRGDSPRRELFELEVATAKLAGLHGFGPLVIDNFICAGPEGAVGVLIMERIHGLTLKMAMVTEPLEQRRNDMFNSALHAIEQMHDAGVFHQDLHSQNIMITQNDRCWIIDFGFSWVFPSLRDRCPGLCKHLRYYDLCDLIERYNGLQKFGISMPNITKCPVPHDDTTYKEWARNAEPIDVYTHIAKAYPTSNLTGKSRDVIRQMIMTDNYHAKVCIDVLLAPPVPIGTMPRVDIAAIHDITMPR